MTLRLFYIPTLVFLFSACHSQRPLPVQAPVTPRTPRIRCAAEAIQREAERLLAGKALALNHRPVLVQAYVERRPTLMFSSCSGLSPVGAMVASKLGQRDRYHGVTLEGLLGTGSRNAATMARVELFLADGLLTYARDLGAASPSRVLASAGDRGALEQLLTELGPAHPGYLGLVAAMRRYQAIVEQGGWARVAPADLRPGRRHRIVRALKRRLAVEGHLEGSVDDRFDRALLSALRRFQRTHQLAETDRLARRDRAFWRELNLPARRRLQAILLTIRRWRDRNVGREPLYVLVNIPAFRLEVWKDGELLLGDRVVVGKPRPMKCDERTMRRVRAHATPTVSSRIERLVFGPFWNVTPDIREKELEPEQGKSPLYYARHGYEVVASASRDATRVRQLPGPENALGFVKFLFPNPHDIYLHDTPQKRLFQRSTRAFSHGCVRVRRPRVLARLLLSADGQWNEARYARLYRRWRSINFRALRRSWDPARFERLRARGKRLRRVVELREPVPVHVAYHTAAVDGEGAVQFYRDLYRLDHDALDPRPAPRCVPESVLARRRFDRVIEQLEGLEQKARTLMPLIPHATVVAETLLREGRRTRLVKRRLRALRTFSDQHDNLAWRIRSEHDALNEDLKQTKGDGWSRDLKARALRVKRLLDALHEMTLAAERVCHGVIKKTTRIAASTARRAPRP